MCVFLTYQYGLRPKRRQHRRLEAILEGQRLLYNAALEERSQAWSKSHWSVTRIDQNKSLTTIRADDPQGYGALPVTLSRWSLKKVDEAFQAFFRRIRAKRGKAGFPRFKSRHRWLVRLQRIFQDPIDLWRSDLQRHAQAAKT